MTSADLQSKEESPYGLLFLPTPPRPPEKHIIRAAFDRPIRFVLQKLTSKQRNAKLDIILPLWMNPDSNRSQEFSGVSVLVCCVYSLLSFICKEESVSEDGTGSIDIRVLLMYYDPRTQDVSTVQHKRRRFDVVVDLRLLVRSRRPWSRLFIVEGEEGEHIYQQFRAIAFERYGLNSIQDLSRRPERIPGGIVIHRPSALPQLATVENRNYARVVVYRKFDRFNFAARSLLTLAAFLHDLNSLSSRFTAPSATAHFSLVTRAASMPDSEHKSLLSSELESRATEFLMAIGDFQAEDWTSVNLSATNGTKATEPFQIQSHIVESTLQSVLGDEDKWTAIVTYTGDYQEIASQLSGIDQTPLNVFRAPELDIQQE